MTETITVSVDPDVAEMYRAASEGERLKMDLLVNLELLDYMQRNPEDDKAELLKTIRKMRKIAKKRGLTQEILDSILNES